jgi:hypothetical protein
MLQTPRDAAERILEMLKSVYQETLECIPASAADFPHLGLPAYEEFKTWAEGQSLRHLADIEYPALTNNPTTVVARTMVRIHLSADGSNVAEYYQVKPRIDRVLKRLATGLLNLRWIDSPRWALRILRTRHCVSFETEFDDGSFVVSSNAESAGKLASPPSVDALFMPYNTAPEALLESHVRRVQTKLATRPQYRAIVVSDFAGAREQHRRLSEQKRAYRAAQDWISNAELNAMTDNRALADAVFAELKKLQMGSRHV